MSVPFISSITHVIDPDCPVALSTNGDLVTLTFGGTVALGYRLTMHRDVAEQMLAHLRVLFGEPTVDELLVEPAVAS